VLPTQMVLRSSRGASGNRPLHAIPSASPVQGWNHEPAGQDGELNECAPHPYQDPDSGRVLSRPVPGLGTSGHRHTDAYSIVIAPKASSRSTTTCTARAQTGSGTCSPRSSAPLDRPQGDRVGVPADDEEVGHLAAAADSQPSLPQDVGVSNTTEPATAGSYARTSALAKGWDARASV